MKATGNRINTLSVIGVLLSVLLACGLGEKKEELEQLAQQLQEQAEAFEESVSGDSLSPAETLEKFSEAFGPGEDFEPINVEEMRRRLPDRLAGLPLQNSNTNSNTMGNLKFTETIGEYANEDGSSTLTLKYSDFGALSSSMLAIVAAWSLVDTEQKTDDGFEHTGRTSDDYPMREEFRKTDGDIGYGSRDVVVDKRVGVSVSGRNLTWDRILDASEKATSEAKKLAKAAS